MRRVALGAVLCIALSAGDGNAQPASRECQAAENVFVMTARSPSPFRVALGIRPARPAVSTPFVVELEVCDNDGRRVERLAIDATIPAHRHGMNYKPELVAIGNGRYEARGFLFHMPGRWEITLSLYDGTASSQLNHVLELR